MGTRYERRFRELVTLILNNSEIYTSQVDRLYNQTPMVLTVNLVNSLISFSYYFPAFVAYVFPAVLPMAGRFFWDGWAIHGDLMVVFAATITLAAYNSARGF